jgi:hypothetical protein
MPPPQLPSSVLNHAQPVEEDGEPENCSKELVITSHPNTAQKGQESESTCFDREPTDSAANLEDIVIATSFQALDAEELSLYRMIHSRESSISRLRRIFEPLVCQLRFPVTHIPEPLLWNQFLSELPHSCKHCRQLVLDASMLRKSIVLDDSILQKLVLVDSISMESILDGDHSKNPQNYKRFKTTLGSHMKVQRAFADGCHILIQLFTPRKVYERDIENGLDIGRLPGKVMICCLGYSSDPWNIGLFGAGLMKREGSWHWRPPWLRLWDVYALPGLLPFLNKVQNLCLRSNR